MQWLMKFMYEAIQVFERDGKEAQAVVMAVLMKDGTVAYVKRNLSKDDYRGLLAKALEDADWFYDQPERPVFIHREC